MKKFLAILISALLVCCVMTAAVAASPSITVKDLNSATVSSTSPTTSFVVNVVSSPTADAVVSELSAASSAADYFGAEVKAEMEALLPDVDVAALPVKEVVAVKLAGYYSAASGSADVEIATATVYKNGQPVVANVGIMVNGKMVWYAQKAQVKNGKVVVTLTAEVLELLGGNEAVVAIVG